jgi:glycosyltransferase involved in cell wall biosynthesis
MINPQASLYEICPGAGEPGLVSVILPTYNRAYSVGQAIQSVLDQTYRPIEIIVVDDGSTDKTSEVVARFGSDVRYVAQENAGVAAARNHGFAIARGEFVALIDSDDTWYPHKLEMQVAFLRKFPEAGMVWTDMTAVRDNGEKVYDAYLRIFYKAYERVRTEDFMRNVGSIADLRVDVPNEVAARNMYVGDIFSQLIGGTLVHTPTTLLRRERVRGTGGYDEELRPNGEDFDFHLRTAVQGPVGFLDVSTIDYRIGNEDQLTAPSQGLTMARAYLKTINRWKERHQDRITLSPAEFRDIVTYANRWVGQEALILGHHSEARRHLGQAVRGDGLASRTSVLYLLALTPRSVFQVLRRVRRRLRS